MSTGGCFSSRLPAAATSTRLKLVFFFSQTAFVSVLSCTLVKLPTDFSSLTISFFFSVWEALKVMTVFDSYSPSDPAFLWLFPPFFQPPFSL